MAKKAVFAGLNQGGEFFAWHIRGSCVKDLCRRFLLVFVAFLFSSCSLNCFFSHDILLETPERPTAWSGLGSLMYEVSWKDERGTERSVILAEGESLIIRLRRGQRQAILALPRRGAAVFRPAGALYPFDIEEPNSEIPSLKPDLMRLSYPSGYAVAVANQLAEAGHEPWAYPLEKLAMVPGSLGRDPWTLQPWQAAQALLDGNFRTSLFPKPSNALKLPEGELWWPESPTCVLDRNEAGTTAMLPTGIHLFYSDREKLFIAIRGEAVIIQRSFLVEK